MLNELILLWTLRERPDTAKRLLVVWAKRILTFPALVRLLMRSSWLRFRGARIGKLSIIGAVKIEGNPRNLKVGEGVSIGRCTMILHGEISIGNYAVISDGAILLTASHKLSDPSWKSVIKPISIDEYAWIAAKAIILPGVKLGYGAVAGAGAVVRSDIPDLALAVGNPQINQIEKRIGNLKYCPVFLNAPFEAWVGSRRSI